jgi:hypothetical protein
LVQEAAVQATGCSYNFAVGEVNEEGACRRKTYWKKSGKAVLAAGRDGGIERNELGDVRVSDLGIMYRAYEKE